MRRFNAYMTTIPATVVIMLCSLLFSAGAFAQVKYQSNGSVKLTVEGTSNIHDWDMTSEKGFCSAEFLFTPTGHLAGLSTLSFTVPAESLKSDSKGMDKNAYKALNTSKFAIISFSTSNATIKPNGTGGFILNTKGKLTVSGVTRDVDLVVNGVINNDKSITYSGTYKLKMTDYKVEPPSIMFGAIKTGDAVNVKFDLTLRQL